MSRTRFAPASITPDALGIVPDTAKCSSLIDSGLLLRDGRTFLSRCVGRGLSRSGRFGLGLLLFRLGSGFDLFLRAGYGFRMKLVELFEVEGERALGMGLRGLEVDAVEDGGGNGGENGDPLRGRKLHEGLVGERRRL